MSKEMWEFDEDGDLFFEKCVHGFLPELFLKWNTMGTNHGLSIVVVTPATGIFEVDKKLCRMTTQRMIDNGISLDLVCLSKPPLHSVPIFHFMSRDPSSVSISRYFSGQSNETHDTGGSMYHPTNSGATNRSERSFERQSGLEQFSARSGSSEKRYEAVVDHLYTDDNLQEPYHGFMRTIYMIPDWVECSFWSRKRPSSDWDPRLSDVFRLDSEHDYLFRVRCKMYEVQMMGLMDMGSNLTLSMPPLDIFDAIESKKPLTGIDQSMICQNYDDMAFKLPPDRKLGDDMESNHSVTGLNASSISRQTNSPEPSLAAFHRTNSNPYAQSMGEDFTHETTPSYKGNLRVVNRSFGGSLPKSIPFTNDRWMRDLQNQIKPKNHILDVKDDEDDEETSPYSSSIEPIKIHRNNQASREYESFHKRSYSTDSRGASPVPENTRPISKFSPSKPAIKMDFLRHNYVNPFQLKKVKAGIDDRRWEHIFPVWVSHEGNEIYTNWKSLSSPASLPLTIEYFPSPKELSEFYQEYMYTVSPAYDNTRKSSEIEQRKIEDLLIELISQRLSQGFQLIVSSTTDVVSTVIVKPVKGNKNLDTKKAGIKEIQSSNGKETTKPLFSISKPYFLCLGDHVHRLFYDASGNNVEVKRYTRRVTHNTDPISYVCSIWSKNQTAYHSRNVTFSYPALANYNWNYLDHLISGYQDQMTDALRFWRIRFLLIPTEAPPTNGLSSNVLDKLDDDEERLVGFTKFIDMIERAKYITPEEKMASVRGKQNALDIQLTTFNLSSLVGREEVHSLLPEAFQAERPSNDTSPNNIDKLSQRATYESIANAMQKEFPIGLPFQDRHWHFQVHQKVVTGEELINWLMEHIADLDTRDSAIAFGNSLIGGGLIEHAKQTHKLLLDGFYFYRLCEDFHKPITDTTPAASKRKRFQAVKQVPIDMDPLKLSSRTEVAFLHYDTTHNPKNCYHFQLHWLVCTARLVEDMLSSWARMAEKCGFKLVEAPGGQASATGDDNPFQALSPIKLAVSPPSIEKYREQFKSKNSIAEEWFEREFVKSFNFILDTESDRYFPPNSRGYSYQRKPWPNTQFIHRHGIAFIQILPKNEGFLWVNNRLHLANSSNSKPGFLNTTQISPDVARKTFEDFCRDEARLKAFFHTLEMRLQDLTVSDMSTLMMVEALD
ncbi:vacuolar membrane-associated protein iml1 [Globomyces sp. JEL0801]|nr:vacuolar membrane-associated protein iml1 [Globomyces sp. JEL0801]